MNNKAILIVSFGTSHEDTRAKNITVFAEDIREKFPQYTVAEAFTSGMIIRVLAKRGIEVDTTEIALEKLACAGVEDVFIMSTHLIPGDEYEKMCNAAQTKEHLFKNIKIAQPLFATENDCKNVLEILAKNNPLENGEAFVLMGHGTEHAINPLYAKLNSLASEMDFKNMFIGTVEAEPTLDDVVSMLKNTENTKVLLAPLMLVAGDHAKNDMASDEDDSWNTVLKQNGFDTRVMLKGLGEYEEIRKIYTEHLEKVL